LRTKREAKPTAYRLVVAFVPLLHWKAIHPGGAFVPGMLLEER